MRIAVVHGYYLGDSGSGIYVRNLVRGLLDEGHDVTLICQERHPERYDHIDSVWELDTTNTRLRPVSRAFATASGGCRLVRPYLGGRLLVYVDGPFDGFSRSGVTTLQDASGDDVVGYVQANTQALRTIFAEWPPDVVFAQHVVIQPFAVREALGDRTPYVITTHGSELTFTLKHAPHLARYALDGLAGASAIAAVSPASATDLESWTIAHDMDVSAKTHVLTPGVDTSLFAPSPSKAEAVADLRTRVGLPEGFDLSAADDIIAFAGRLAWYKGAFHAVSALSLVSVMRPRAKMLIAGDGPARLALERLSELLCEGDLERARELAALEMRVDNEVDSAIAEKFGPPLPDRIESAGPARIAFLGHLSTADVARVFAAADVALTPSLIPEAAALVASEALSAGALPIVAYHSGLRALADVVSEELGDPGLRELAPSEVFTTALAEGVIRNLERYPTSDAPFRERLHRIATERLPSWRSVARSYVELGAGVVR